MAKAKFTNKKTLNAQEQYEQALAKVKAARLIMPSRKSRDFSHGMDRLTQRPLGHFFFWSALYF